VDDLLSRLITVCSNSIELSSVWNLGFMVYDYLNLFFFYFHFTSIAFIVTWFEIKLRSKGVAHVHYSFNVFLNVFKVSCVSNPKQCMHVNNIKIIHIHFPFMVYLAALGQLIQFK